MAAVPVVESWAAPQRSDLRDHPLTAPRPHRSWLLRSNPQQPGRLSPRCKRAGLCKGAYGNSMRQPDPVVGAHRRLQVDRVVTVRPKSRSPCGSTELSPCAPSRGADPEHQSINPMLERSRHLAVWVDRARRRLRLRVESRGGAGRSGQNRSCESYGCDGASGLHGPTPFVVRTRLLAVVLSLMLEPAPFCSTDDGWYVK